MKRRSVLTIAVVVLAALFALWGCPKKADMSAVPEAQAPAAAEATPEAKEEAEEAKERAAAAAAKGLQPIYFDFDQSLIRTDARIAMEENAEWLKMNSKVKLRIEGNCDERGTIEYNQALGQRRAAAAKKYLVDLGISAGRISLLSYGKEKPICTDHDEDCWQKNRRADFVTAD